MHDDAVDQRDLDDVSRIEDIEIQTDMNKLAGHNDVKVD